MPRHPQVVPSSTVFLAPPTLWVLDGLPVGSALALEAVLERLEALPVHAWQEIGARCAGADESAAGRRARAMGAVEEAITARGLRVTAWFVGDLVSAASYPALRHTRQGPRRVRHVVCAARVAAEWMALATATRCWITARDHATLCMPFIGVVDAPLLHVVD